MSSSRVSSSHWKPNEFGSMTAPAAPRASRAPRAPFRPRPRPRPESRRWTAFFRRWLRPPKALLADAVVRLDGSSSPPSPSSSSSAPHALTMRRQICVYDASSVSHSGASKMGSSAGSRNSTGPGWAPGPASSTAGRRPSRRAVLFVAVFVVVAAVLERLPRLLAHTVPADHVDHLRVAVLPRQRLGVEAERSRPHIGQLVEGVRLEVDVVRCVLAADAPAQPSTGRAAPPP